MFDTILSSQIEFNRDLLENNVLLGNLLQHRVILLHPYIFQSNSKAHLLQ